MVQQIVNIRGRIALDTSTFVTQPLQQVYPLAASVPAAGKLIGVREGQRDLAPIRWEELSETDRRWHRRVGTRFEVFAPVGRDLFVVHPAQTSTSTVTVVSAKLTNSLTFDADILEVRVDDIPLILDLTETVLLMRMRLYQPAAAAAARASTAMQVTA